MERDAGSKRGCAMSRTRGTQATTKQVLNDSLIPGGITPSTKRSVSPAKKREKNSVGSKIMLSMWTRSSSSFSPCCCWTGVASGTTFLRLRPHFQWWLRAVGAAVLQLQRSWSHREGLSVKWQQCSSQYYAMATSSRTKEEIDNHACIRIDLVHSCWGLYIVFRSSPSAQTQNLLVSLCQLKPFWYTTKKWRA